MMNYPTDTINDQKTPWNLTILPANQQRELTRRRAQAALISRLSEETMTEIRNLYSYADYLAATHQNNSLLLGQAMAGSNGSPLDVKSNRLSQDYVDHITNVANIAAEKLTQVVQRVPVEPEEVGLLEELGRAIRRRLEE